MGKGTWPVQSSTLRTGQYLSSPVQSPSRESYSFTSASHQPVGQSSSTATKTPAYYGQSSAMLFKEQSAGFFPSNGDSRQPPRLFTRGTHVPKQDYSQLKSSASSPARRVSLRRTNFEALKAAPRAPDQSESTDSYNPSYSQGIKAYRSLLFSANGGGNVQGEPNFIPRAVKSSSFSHGQPAPAYSQNTPSSLLQQHSVQMPITRGHVRYQPSYTSTAEKHIPNSVGSPKVLWNTRTTTQEAHNLPASGSGQTQYGGTETSGPRFAPTVVHKIPKPYGGFPIRRLRDPVESIADVKRPQPTQLTYTAPPQQRVSSTQKAQDHKKSKWTKIRLG
ncbi:uncharacterized protein LOC115367258 isoform X2 [Myripristis murdjan]|uniref:uncharacterized protein LOC115367258 isoform X2 n=2 Tax=Myripristis murdjan TaxID=586833 RepID=UPI0011763755|nr:uncharacterized protein LOC115367258 isoform X2 [Myripristis murdjan]